MNKTATEQRQNFRLQASGVEADAGLVIGKRIVPAQMLNYSSTGASLRLLKNAKVVPGDELGVATSKGKYLAVVRRVFEQDGDKFVGVEFLKLMKETARSEGNPWLPVCVVLFLAICATFYYFFG